MRSLLFYKRILYLLYLYKNLILQISFLFSIFSPSCYFYFVGVCTHVCMPQCTWSENNLGNLFFPSTWSQHRTEVVMLGTKCLYQLNYLTDFCVSLFIVFQTCLKIFYLEHKHQRTDFLHLGLVTILGFLFLSLSTVSHFHSLFVHFLHNPSFLFCFSLACTALKELLLKSSLLASQFYITRSSSTHYHWTHQEKHC